MLYASAPPRRFRGFALAAWLVLAPAGAASAGPEACERAAAEAARLAGVPAAVLQAIALVETGRRVDGDLRPWPWAVNREGEGHWFPTRDDALAFARASLGQGRPSFDLGCFQINYRHHGDGFPSLEAMADPGQGALYAARFLRQLHAEFGDWSAAAGAYHSRTPERARRYRARFESVLAGLERSSPDGRTALEGSLAPAREAARRPGGTIRRIRGPRIITVAPEEAAREREDGA